MAALEQTDIKYFSSEATDQALYSVRNKTFRDVYGLFDIRFCKIRVFKINT